MVNFEARTILNPTIEDVQLVMYFQFQNMGWNVDDMEEEIDRWSSVPFGYVIGEINGKILSVANLLKRHIKFDGVPIKLGGIGGVCTHVDYRNKGYSSKVLKQAINVLKKNDLDVAFLNTELVGFYEKFGFVGLSKEYIATGRSGKKYINKGGMIAPLNARDKFELILDSKSLLDLNGLDW